MLVISGIFYLTYRQEISDDRSVHIEMADIDKTPIHQVEIRDKLLAILDKNNPNTIFKVIDTIHDDPDLSVDCHNIAHDIGHHSYEMFGFSEAMTFDNPEHLNHTSIEHVCAGGYMHGVLEEISLHDPEFKNNPESVCNRIPEESQSSCFHGVGHVIMYAHDRDVALSLTNCRVIKTRNNIYRCFEGVRMEQFWGNLNDKPDPNLLGWDYKNPMNTCRIAKDDEKPTCYLYSTFGYLRFTPRDYLGAGALCRQGFMSEEDQHFCLKGLGMTMMSKFKGQKLEGSEVYVDGYTVTQKHAFYQGLINFSNLSGITTEQLKKSCESLKNDRLVCLDALAMLEW